MRNIISITQICTFVIAACIAVISTSEATTPPPPVIYGRSYIDECIAVTNTIEDDCTPQNSGFQCTVLLNTGEVAPAYRSPGNSPPCLQVLRRVN